MLTRLQRSGIWTWELLSRSEVAAGLFVGSLLLLVASVAIVPMMLRRLPADYFASDGADRPRSWVATLECVGRNLFGLVLLGLGIAMLVLPGQGILTIVASLVLLDFPGRRAILRRIVGLPRVRQAVDAWRRAVGATPFVLPPPDSDSRPLP
ncbi:MAG: hypothetical protein JW751_15790 [Polyangiaceae bacterium]|nr:hypothetical protein [Polyangiaceae bacterium]